MLLVTDVRDAKHQPSQVSAKAKAAAFRALQINASSPWAHAALAGDFFCYDWDWARAEAEFENAIAEDQAAIALDPHFPRARYSFGWASVRRGLFAQAAKEFQKAADLSHGDRQTLSAFTAYLDAVSGKRRRASRTIRQLEKNSRPVTISPYVMAEIYTALGEKDHAFASLEKAYQQRQFGMVFLKVDPDLDGIRSEVRFRSLLRRMAFLQ